MYATVPSTTPGPVSRASVGECVSSSVPTTACRARPKSRIFTIPSFVTKRFSGLMSRWMTPLSCAAARPRVTCSA